MHCKHCGKELEYDINNNAYTAYNGNVYCDTDCMLFDVNYGNVDVSSFSKEDWDSFINFDEMSIKDAMSILIRHNKRRRGQVPSKYEMANPTATEIGKAIEVAVDTMNKYIEYFEE